MPEPSREPVNIDAHVVRQLGDQLITDAEQALLELVKNSYDADATLARVSVSTTATPPTELGLPETAVGAVTVNDDGFGMDHETITNGWLVISFSLKRDQKQATGKPTPKGRTPLGDKGLGRLSTMKLGDYLEIVTHYDKNKPGHRVLLSWSDFQSGKKLSQISAQVSQVPPTGRNGTRLTVYGLSDPEYWLGDKQLRSLQIKMSRLISPFEAFQDFRVSVFVNDKKLDLLQLSPQLRDTATIGCNVDWKKQVLRCSGRVKIQFLRGDREEEFQRWVLADDGAALRNYLLKLPGAQGHELKRCSGSWFLEFARTWSWKELSDRRQGQASYADPGPFHGELDAFDLKTLSSEQVRVFSRLQEYRDYVTSHARVSIFRDGFGVRMPEDWLGLGRAWTSGGSYYGLKPANTIGFIAISAKDNPNLTEKSDREGFIDTPYSRGLYELLEQFVKFENDALEFLRRSYNSYREEKRDEEARLPPKWQPEDAAAKLRNLTAAAKIRKRLAAREEKSRQAGAAKLRRTLEDALSDAQLSKRVRNEIMIALGDLERVIKEWDEKKQELDDALQQFSEQEKLADAILERFDRMEQQTTDLYDTVALGLVAQALAHDVHALVEDLLNRTQRLGKRYSGDPTITSYCVAVRATANALRKQLTILDPMLRPARETRQDFTISAFLKDMLSYREERLMRFGIKPRIEMRADFHVKMNMGRLLQVVDNLVRNSEYWLRQYAPKHPKAYLELHFVVDEPKLYVFDTGPGIKPALEDTLFDLFVTDKPQGEGSGLGLFIASQLLERENCRIRLDSERNQAGRRYRFSIDFSGAIADGK